MSGKTMLFKHTATPKNPIKVGKEEFDHVIVEGDDVAKYIKDGWIDEPNTSKKEQPPVALTKKQLVEKGALLGIELASNLSNAKMEKAIEEKEAEILAQLKEEAEALEIEIKEEWGIDEIKKAIEGVG